MKKIILLLIRLYSYIISPLIGKNCRYYPTCSAYAYESIEVHGIIKGLFLATKRIISCNPWGGSGYNPVPKKIHNEKE